MALPLIAGALASLAAKYGLKKLAKKGLRENVKKTKNELANIKLKATNKAKAKTVHEKRVKDAGGHKALQDMAEKGHVKRRLRETRKEGDNISEYKAVDDGLLQKMLNKGFSNEQALTKIKRLKKMRKNNEEWRAGKTLSDIIKEL